VTEISGCDQGAGPVDVTAAAANPSSWYDVTTTGSKCWILVQRNDGNDDEFFARDWHNYSHGFGNASGNFWIGNQHLHQLTQILNSGLTVFDLDFVTELLSQVQRAY